MAGQDTNDSSGGAVKGGAVDNTQTTTPKKGGRWWKVLLGLAILLFVFVAMLPTIISAGFKGVASGAIDGASGAETDIKALSLGWFGSQSIEGVTLLDPAGKPFFAVDKIQNDQGLLSLAFGSGDLGTTTITGLVINVTLDEDGQSNIQTLGSSKPTRPEKDAASSNASASNQLPADLAMALKIVNATINFKQAGLDEINIRNLNVSIDLKTDGSPITAAFDAAISQALLQGEIQGNAEIKNFVDSSGAVDETNAQINVSAKTSDLPVAGIDRLLKQNGLLTAALGDKLNLNFSFTGALDQPTLALQINADRLQLSRFSGAIQNDRFVMDNPTQITLTATPALTTALQKNGYIQDLALTQNTSLNLQIQTLALPLDGDLDRLSVKLNIFNDSDIVLQGDEDLGRVVLSDLAADIDTQSLSQNVNLDLNAKLNVDGQDGAIQSNIQVANLVTASGQLDLANLKPNISATVTNLPLSLVDRLGNLDGLAVAALGDRIEQLTIKSSGSSTGTQLTASLQTPQLTITSLPLTLGDTLNLTQPVTVPYTLTPELLAKLAGPKSPLTLDHPVKATLTLSRLTAKLPDANAFDPTQTALTATLDLADTALQFAQKKDTLPIKLTNAQIKINADSLAKTSINLKATTRINDKGALASLGAMNLDLITTASVKSDSTLGPVDSTLNLTAKGLSANLKLDIADGLKSATLQKGSTVNITLDNPRLRDLGLLAETGPALAAPTTLALTLDQTEIPLKNFKLNKITVGAVADLATLALTGDPKLKNASLNNTQAKVNFNGPTGAATILLTANIKTSGGSGGGAGASPLSVNAKLANLLDKQGELQIDAANIDADINLTDLPAPFVDALSGGGSTLTDLAGPIINLDAKAQTAGGFNADGHINLKLRSARLQADAALKLGKTLQQTKPANIKLTLTPQSYAKLTTPPPSKDAKKSPAAPKITLLKDVLVQITLNKISGPGDALTDPAQLGFDATLTASPISMRNDKTNQVALFNNAIANINTTQLAKTLNVKLNGDVGLASANLGKLATTAIVTNPLPKDPKTKPSIKLNTQLKDVSVHAVDTLLNKDGLIVALLGDTLNLTLDADLKQMAGPARLTLNATHAKADLPLILNDGFATLQNDATAQLSIQESLGQRFVSHPLLKQAVKSENPITVLIAKKNFRIPIENFDIANVNVEKLTVDPGKIVIRNAGLVRTLTQLPQTVQNVTRGKLDDFRKKENDEMTAWFTPVDVSIIKGIATYSRMDMLLGDNYQIATWGKVDLLNDYGDMVLGIAERAMRRIYGVQLYKDDPTYVDQFPMIGPLATLGPDMKDLNLRLGLLTGGGTVAKIGGKSGEKLFSQILGGLTKIDQATNKKRKFIKPAPAPRLPFPWPDEVAATTPVTQTQPDPNQPAQQPTTEPAPADQPKELTKEEKLSRDIDTGLNLLKGLFKKK